MENWGRRRVEKVGREDGRIWGDCGWIAGAGSSAVRGRLWWWRGWLIREGRWRKFGEVSRR